MYDAVVVGLGGVGSFALRALAKQGKGGRFLGLEQYEAGHHCRGSSHGRSRIYRRAYFEHESYVPWIEHSIREFRLLEETHNTSLLNECGCLLVAPTFSDNRKSLPPLLSASQASAVKHDIPVEFLDTQDLRDRFPQLLYRHDMVGLIEPQAGILRPERVVQAALADVRQTKADVTIMNHTTVQSIQSVPDGSSSNLLTIQFQQDNGDRVEVQTRSVLVSAGAWAGRLLPTWSPVLNVTRQFQCWIDVAESESSPLYSSDQLPAWYMESPDWPIPIYGLPYDLDGDDHSARYWIKVSTHGRTSIVPDASLNQPRLSDVELEECQKAAYLGLNPLAWSHRGDKPKFVESIPCLYTMSPDGNYLIGSPMPGVFAVGGLSGHGFKMTPALGQMMADFALGNDLATWNTEFCAPSRFPDIASKIS